MNRALALSRQTLQILAGVFLFLALSGCAPTTAIHGVADVRSFGAIGDGKADDTDAIRKAADSGAGTVRFERGIYRLTSPITINLNEHGPISLVGDGTARIVMEGAGPAFHLVA